MNFAFSTAPFSTDGQNCARNIFDIKSDSTKPIEHLFVTWTINNFLNLKKFSEKSINSPPIQVNFPSDSWMLNVYPYFLFSEDNNIQFSLLRNASSKSNAFVTYRFGVKKSNITWFPMKSKVSFPINGSSFVLCNIFEYFGRQDALFENKLIVLCEMYITYNTDIDKLFARKVNELETDVLDLSLNLINVFKKIDTSDVIIKVKDLVIPVHKAILAARSSVFAEILTDDTPCINVSEDDYDHIKNIIAYIYTANFNWIIMNGISIGLYESAKRLKVHGLTRFLAPMQIDVSSLVKEESINFTWKIDGFSNLDIQFDECITSPPFHAGYRNAPVFHLDIYAGGCHRAPNSIGIYLRTNDLNKSSDLKINIAILDEFKNELCTKDANKLLYLNFVYGCPQYASKEELRERFLLRNDKLIVNCKIKSLTIVESYDKISSFSYDEFECYEQLSADMGNLLLGEDFCDCVIIAPNEMAFSAHMTILSVRSTVFEFLLKKSKQDNYILYLDNVSAAVLEEMLHFCYTGKIKPCSSSFSIKLYEAAKLYKIMNLARRCIFNLLYTVDDKCLCEVISFSYKHEETGLFTRCLMYLKLIHEKITCSTEWQNFVKKEEHLAYKIYRWLEAPLDKPLNLLDF